ncbi:oligosaccharide repeat unit polymerase [Ornithinibacillus sp. BX22]|uniref:Oligosaccharide repeat unit polymerase n=1 Tax=Ornithinibacillus hominis TaxID=2763055 RepID=A0A923RI86_9BACI|nr:oligosaccharide repeat unit polymerase [Ornithinibacillus hominis]MBC5637040.1 oligosaccharide repeat unit polymerase [Ornithinibacillus hominis]
MKKVNLINKRFIFIIITVLIIIISTVSYTLSILSEANEQVKRDITNFSRGSYDILIRPGGKQTEVEKQLNIIEENYLGVGDGGITIEEWEEIKNHPQVEVAAPVASIGLFTARKRTWMIERENLQYYEVDYYTSDGVNSYKSKEDTFMYDFQGNFDSPRVQYPSSFEVGDNFFIEEIATFYFPTSYHQVVAVDAVEEEKLTHHDLGLLNKPVENIFGHYVDDQDLAIPILSLKDVPVPSTIKLTIDDLEEPTESEIMEWNSRFINENPIQGMIEQPDIYHRVVDEFISKKRLHNELVYTFKPEDGPSPFENLLLYVDENMKLAPDDGTGENMLGGAHQSLSQNIGYQLEPIQYELIDKKNLEVKQTGIDDVYHVPTYREIQEIEFFELDEISREPLNRDEAFEFYNVGFFSIQENTEDLASSPLGIYGREMPYLASNRDIKLHPSAVPGSFITTPAHGLISIDWAEKIKGNAPIDAIRVKIAELEGYDKSAAAIIRDVANEWENKGFTVDIVAGASLQDITVDVEGIGKVVQPFTTLGAADTVISSWNTLQIMLTVLYGIVAITFVGFTFFNLLSDRQKDEQLLAKLGWSEKVIGRIRYKEWIWMLGTPIFIVLIGFSLFGIRADNWLPFIFSIGVSCIFVVLLVIAEHSIKRKPRLIKRQGRNIAIQNIHFYQYRLVASCIQLFLSTILTCFLPFFLIQNVESTTQTRLGSYIHGEIEGLFIVIVVLLYILTVITVYQSLRRMWKKRKKEIQLFLFLGWGKSATRTYFVKEVFLWAGLTTAFGWVVSLFITWSMTDVSFDTVLLGIAGFLLVFAVALGCSMYSLHQVIEGGEKIAN